MAVVLKCLGISLIPDKDAIWHFTYYCAGYDLYFVTTPTQPQHNLNLVGFDMIIAVHTTPPPPPGTLLPSNAASDQPLMLPKLQHQH